ncbi:MAG: serine hydroxymethyltransferase [Acidimicrobiales bacterium]|jgi:glycine hydroxymethyltransferase
MIPDDQSVFDCPLAELDPELYELIGGELGRQRTTLDLVASESVPPRAVLEAQGSILTAKYADGYPGDRAYDTCEWIDEIERLAIERAKSLFCADHANVQPYSGASSNMAVLHGLCEPGDPILGWDFEHGGHETHYWQGTSAGRFYRSAAYGVRRQDRLVDMEQVAEMAESLRPKVIFAGWSCYSRWIDFRRFREICDDVGAYLVVDMAHFSGLVAAGLHPDPVPYADACTMTVHKTLGGARGGAILCRAELADRIDAAVYPGEQGCPLPHVIAGKAVTFAIAATDGFRDRMERTVEGARAIAGALTSAVERTSAPVVTGGTDVHQFLVDLAPSGRDSNIVLAQLNEVGVSANAVRLAFDEAERPGASGLRFGANPLAARGFGPTEFVVVGEILADALEDRSGGRARDLNARVRALLEGFPLYRFL